jgi:hypothetical protein
MNLAIVTIANRGDLSNERLHLKVKADTGLGSYVALATVYSSPTTFTAMPKALFWFPAKPVKAGDNIVLYTKAGSAKSELQADGTTNHFFYWGKAAPLFNASEDCCVVLELNSWEASPFK